MIQQSTPSECENYVRIARIRGKLVKYNACSALRSTHAGCSHMQYIGMGTIESINGIPQSGKLIYYFWKEIV